MTHNQQEEEAFLEWKAAWEQQEQDEQLEESIRLQEEAEDQIWDEWRASQQAIEEKIFEIVKDLESWEFDDIIFGVRCLLIEHRQHKKSKLTK